MSSLKEVMPNYKGLYEQEIDNVNHQKDMIKREILKAREAKDVTIIPTPSPSNSPTSSRGTYPNESYLDPRVFTSYLDKMINGFKKEHMYDSSKDSDSSILIIRSLERTNYFLMVLVAILACLLTFKKS